MKNGNVVKGSYVVEVLPKDEAREVYRFSEIVEA